MRVPRFTRARKQFKIYQIQTKFEFYPSLMEPNLEQTINLQRKASNPKNSAWVFASAGSGKTKILTDRVLRLLLEGVAPNKILCLTFTKVAAAEMQSRINSELAKWILCSDLELEKKLNDLSGTFPNQTQIKKARTLFVKIIDEDSKIKVQTIHSFCQIIIKIFPFEAQVKPNFEVLETNREKLLLKQAQKEVLKQALNDSKLRNLIQKTNAKINEQAFSELVEELLKKKEQIIFLKEKFFGIENVIEQFFKNFGIKKGKTEQEIFEDFFAKFNHQKNHNLIFELENSDSSKNIESAKKLKKFLNNPVLENFTFYKSAFLTQENEPRKIYGKVSKNSLITDFVADCQKSIFSFFEQLNSLKIADNSSLLLSFVDQILQHYSYLKNQNAFLDYNDLIVETNRLLANPDFSTWVKLKMDGTFDHILIDESQDTNHAQWNIIKALSEDFFSGLSASNNNRSIFIVGDEKQSIYSFQGSEPDISAEIFAYFSHKLGDNLQKIELNNSFRSLPKILEAVDQVFQDPQRQKAISKASEFQNHKAIRQGLGKVEIWQQIQNQKKEKEEKNYEWQIDFNAQKTIQEEEILVQIIANKINEKIAANQANYGDFMILLRNRTNAFSQSLNKIFHQYQIPFSSVSKIKFSESLLIQDLLAAAKFALLGDDDLNLACLLKSPIFEISEKDLFEICLFKNQHQITIYKALESLEKFSLVKKNLDELIKKSQELNCFEFFYFLLHQKNHQQNFIAHFGYESLEILDKFLLSVADFCKNFSPNLQKFLEFIEKLDLEIALSSNQDNRVKISTIHSAKGLQAKFVLLCDCCYNFSQLPSAKEEISWIEFAGNKFPVWCGKKEDENLILKKHRQEKLIEAKEEYLRLLYVAMTRAEDELWIGGFGKSSDPESWYEIIKNSVSCGEFLSMEELLKAKPNPNSIEENDFLKSKKIIADDYKNLPINNFLEPKPKQNLTLSEVSKTPQSQINQAQIKGRLIHKILEIIGKNHLEEKNWLLELVKKIIDREEFLKPNEKNQILDQISNFMASNQFNELFFGKINCEVEISGEVENQKIIARIDLLIERENEILIVDYKSDQTLPEKPAQQYLNQLKTYKNLLKNLYPKHQIRTAIFWINFLKLEIL